MLSYQDSNLDRQNQKLQCYHYTIRQSSVLQSASVITHENSLRSQSQCKVTIIFRYIQTNFGQLAVKILFQDGAVCTGGCPDLVVAAHFLSVRDGVGECELDGSREVAAPVPAMEGISRRIEARAKFVLVKPVAESQARLEISCRKIHLKTIRALVAVPYPVAEYIEMFFRGPVPQCE